MGVTMAEEVNRGRDQVDSPSVSALRITQLKPKYLEIMDRVICGQQSKKIAEEMGLSPARLSVIINSPLFKLEMRRRRMRRETRVLEIEDELLEAAKLGVKLHKEILESPPGAYSTDIKLKSATTMAGLGMKLMGSRGDQLEPNNGDNGDGEGYEERLKQVTITERVRTVSPIQDSPPPSSNEEIEQLLAENYPLDDDTDLPPGEENDIVEVDDGVDTFIPTPKIEDILKND